MIMHNVERAFNDYKRCEREDSIEKEGWKECSNCGERNPSNQIFCIKCRSRFVDSYG